MEGTGVHQFALTDARGVVHQYVVTEHPAGEGMELMYSLLGLGAPTVLGLAGAALGSEGMLRAILGALRDDGEGLDASGLVGLLAGLDFAKVGAELGLALGTGKAPELTRKVVSRTLRDGKPLPAVFDIAYQANYAELLQLVWRVCTINRFFPVPSTSLSSLLANQATPPGTSPPAA